MGGETGPPDRHLESGHQRRAKQVEQDDQLKTDYLYRFMSEGAGLDLVGHFERWGFSPSAQAQSDVSALGLTVPTSPVWSRTGP